MRKRNKEITGKGFLFVGSQVKNEKVKRNLQREKKRIVITNVKNAVTHIYRIQNSPSVTKNSLPKIFFKIK